MSAEQDNPSNESKSESNNYNYEQPSKLINV